MLLARISNLLCAGWLHIYFCKFAVLKKNHSLISKIGKLRFILFVAELSAEIGTFTFILVKGFQCGKII